VTINVRLPVTVAELLTTLRREYPAVDAIAGSVRVAVNHEFVRDDRIVIEGDEVAIIPPVSGG
jgi:molybdopterin converting factor subunit 1